MHASQRRYRYLVGCWQPCPWEPLTPLQLGATPLTCKGGGGGVHIDPCSTAAAGGARVFACCCRRKMPCLRCIVHVALSNFTSPNSHMSYFAQSPSQSPSANAPTNDAAAHAPCLRIRSLLCQPVLPARQAPVAPHSRARHCARGDPGILKPLHDCGACGGGGCSRCG